MSDKWVCLLVTALPPSLLSVTNRTVSELIVEICNNLSVLYKLSESIAILDMLSAFAHWCTLTESGAVQ